MTQVSVNPPGPPESQDPDNKPQETGEGRPLARLIATVIRKLSSSRLADPKVALIVSGVGLLLGMVVGATAENAETMPVRLPLDVLPSLVHDNVLVVTMFSAASVLACLGLAGMLWARARGWNPDPRLLLLASGVVVALMVCITPTGSSDTASYAAYGRIAAQGGNPYITSPQDWAAHHPAFDPYADAIGKSWRNTLSVYGPLATLIQRVVAPIGGDVATTIWILMILNGLAFIGVGVLLLKTSDDPVRATLFWTANPVLIQQLVGGGHLDTLIAAAAIGSIQVARRAHGIWSDALIGVLLGLACGIKVSAILIALGLAWPLLRRHEWARLARIAAAMLTTIAAVYSYYGLDALKPLSHASQLVALPSPWWLVQVAGGSPHGQAIMQTFISFLWPIALLVVAWLVYKRISSDQPREVVAPFAVTFAWILVSPYALAWYTATPWVALTQVPRNRMTRWLALVTMLLALWRSGGGHGSTP